MRSSSLVLVLLLAACAERSPELAACQHEVLHSYFEGRSVTGAVAGGVLLGPLGGALGSTLDSNEGMKASDINPAIETCLQQRAAQK